MENDTPRIIRRSDKGLTISGTRITLYDVMDYVHAGMPPSEIQWGLSLTEAEVRCALAYIAEHRDDVEAEYRDVVRQAEERRAYHDALLREHLAKTLPPPMTPERAKIHARLATERARLDAALAHEGVDRRSGGQSPDTARS